MKSAKEYRGKYIAFEESTFTDKRRISITRFEFRSISLIFNSSDGGLNVKEDDVRCQERNIRCIIGGSARSSNV